MQDDKAVEDLEDIVQSDSTHEDEEAEEKGVSDSSDEGEPSAVTSVPPKKTKPSFIGVKRMYGEVTLDKELGSGAFGTVYKGTWNGRTVAFKEIDIKTARANQLYGELGTVGLVESLEWEVSRLSTISHPHCVSFYGVYEKEDKYYIGMEFCRGGTLDKALQKGVSWETRYRWAWEMAQGLSYLHDSGVLHRDLKAENILLDAGRAKLGDLGAAEADVLLSDTQAQVVSKGLQDKTFISPERGLSDYNGSMGYEDLSDSPHQKIVWVEAKDVPKDDALDPQVVYVTLNKGKVWSAFLKKDPEKEGLKVSRVIITDPKTIAQIQAGFSSQTEISRAGAEEAFETLSMLCGHIKRRLSDMPAMDIYALGLVFWQMASGGIKPGRPDELDPQRYQNFLLNEAYLREPFPADCPEAFRELILRCWSYDPAQRPSASQLATELQGLLFQVQEKSALMSKAPNPHPDIVEVTPETDAIDEPEGTLDSDAEDAAADTSTIAPSSGYVAAPAALAEALPPEEDQGVPDSESEEEKITSPTETSLTSQTALHNASVDSLSLPGFQAIDRLEHDVHDKRSALLAYLPPYLTASKINEPIDDYWQRIENAKEGEAQNKNAPLVLKQALDDFLSDTQSGVLLLLGEAGLGKTLTTYQRANQLLEAWRDYLSEEGRAKNTPRPAYFPILLRPALSQWTHGHLQNEGLDKALEAYGLTGRHIPLLVIVDGYDECRKDPDAEPQNLVEALGLQAYAKTAPVKVLVTCRPDTVAQRELESRFGWEGSLSVKYFLPFKLEQMLEYMKAQSGWDEKTYQENRERLSQAKDLRTVLRNPFVLQLFTQSWETVSRQKADLNQLKRWDVYAGFVAHWLKTQETLLQDRVKAGLTAENPDLVKSFEVFAAQVAFTAFTQGQIALSGDIPEAHPLAANPWLLLPEQVKQEARRAFAENRASLTKAQQSRVLLQEGEYVRIMENRLSQFESGSPLKRRAGGHEFTHKSFFEYFCAVRLLQLSSEKTPVRVMREGQHLLNHRNVQQEPEIINFWQEGHDVEQHQGLTAPFLDIVKASRHEKNTGTASANAATLLNAVRVSFSAEDWHGVSLKGADLHGALLHRTNLRGADLQEANLQGAILSDADLRQANLICAGFGEFPRLSFNEMVKCTAISPDKNHPLMAVGLGGGIIEIWGGENYAEKRGELKTDSVWSLSFSPDGKRLVSGNQDGSVRLWDVDGQQLLCELKGHTDCVRGVSFSPDGKRLASGSDDKSVRLWDAVSQNQIAELKEHTGSVQSVSFSPDGLLLVSGSDDKSVRLWDVSGQHALAALQGHTRRVTSVSFSPDGKQLVSGSEDKSVRLWDVVGKKALCSLKGHTHHVKSVAFSPDGRQLASGSENGSVRLWDAISQKQIAELKGHTGEVNSMSFSPDGKQLVSGSWDNTVRLWDMISQSQMAELNGHTDSVNSVSFSPDGKQLASGSGDHSIRLWNVARQQLLSKLQGNNSTVLSVSFSPDGNLLASGSTDDIIRLWDVTEKKALYELKGYTDCGTSVSFSPDGNLLASGSEETNRVHLCEVAGQREFAKLKGHKDNVWSVSFSPDGQMLASGGQDKSVRLWEVAGKKALCKLNGHTDSVNSVSFSPDGSRLASGSDDETVRLWDTVSFSALSELKGHTSDVRSVAFSPDGSRLASGSRDKTVRLWDTVSFSALSELKGHTSDVRSVAFSPDGSRLASGSSDHAIFLWRCVSSENQEMWLLQCRFVTAFTLIAFGAHLNGAEISASNQKLLMQNEAEEILEVTGAETTLDENTDREEMASIHFGRFFSREGGYDQEHGERIAGYLEVRDQQSMACMTRSSYAFFKALPARQPVTEIHSTPIVEPLEEDNTQTQSM